MEEENNYNESMIKELEALKESPNTYLFDVAYLIIFFLVQYFYFETDMHSNYIGLLFVIILRQLGHAYASKIKVNKHIDVLINKAKQNDKQFPVFSALNTISPPIGVKHN